MGDNTGIQWTDATWNPARGCSIVSVGCQNCYAMKQAHRFSGPGRPYDGLTRMTAHGPKWSGKIMLVPEKLDEPLRWRKPRRIFVNSMSDLFHEDVPDSFIDQVFAVMALRPKHTFQILTKRPERMSRYVEDFYRDAADPDLSRLPNAVLGVCEATGFRKGLDALLMVNAVGGTPIPLPNVWLGVSVENQAELWRWWVLRRTPAVVRLLSLEPLLEGVDLRMPTREWSPGRCDHCCNGDRCDDSSHHARSGPFPCPYCRGDGRAVKPDWIIVGGESGPGARPCNVEWIRSIVEQCKAAGVPTFVKQLGRHPMLTKTDWLTCPLGDRWTSGTGPDSLGTMVPIDSKGADPHGWPPDLNVREFPR